MGEIDINVIDKICPLPTLNEAPSDEGESLTILTSTCNRVRALLCVTTSIFPSRSIPKLHQGIILGHITRITKLYGSFVFLASENHAESSIIIGRSILETAIVLKYLEKKINDDICKKYIKSSLAYDKKLLEFVQENLIDGEIPLFGKKIIRSIENEYNEAKCKIETINFKNDKDWHDNIFELSKTAGYQMYYELMYRGCSSAVHGSWYHLKTYLLHEKNSHYEPKLQKVNLNIDFLTAINMLCLTACKDYASHLENDNTEYNKAINETFEWHKKLISEYDNFQFSQDPN